MGSTHDPLQKLGAGKVYEAWTLVHVLEQLKKRERVTVAVKGGHALRFRASHGPTSQQFTHFVCTNTRVSFGIWTDIEVLTLSHGARANPKARPVAGDKHELDIVALRQSSFGYPEPHEVLWGIECKHTAFTKAFHRSMLGVRRELSLAAGPHPTPFRTYPVNTVNSSPPSVLTAFSTDPNVARYSRSGAHWDIGYEHLPMP